MNAEIKRRLTEATGTWVRLLNVAHNENWIGMKIHLHGKLEYEDEEDEYSVFLPTDIHGHGSNWIRFRLSDTVDVHRQIGGIWEVTVK